MKNSKKLVLKYVNLALGAGLLMLSINSYAETKEAATSDVAEVPKELNAQTPSATNEATDSVSASSEVKSSAPEFHDFGFKGVRSLRGETGIVAPDKSASIKRLQPDIDPIARNYFQQPPMIPHRTRGYQITVRHNQCMTCHGWDTYKKARATKVSQTHFADRDGNAQSTLAARRYFCTQCHAPQVDAKPLVENKFDPVHELQK